MAKIHFNPRFGFAIDLPVQSLIQCGSFQCGSNWPTPSKRHTNTSIGLSFAGVTKFLSLSHLTLRFVRKYMFSIPRRASKTTAVSYTRTRSCVKNTIAVGGNFSNWDRVEIHSKHQENCLYGRKIIVEHKQAERRGNYEPFFLFICSKTRVLVNDAFRFRVSVRKSLLNRNVYLKKLFVGRVKLL